MRGRGSWRQNAEPLKFEGDFDFESSNAQFDKEEIEKELKQKLTISLRNCIVEHKRDIIHTKSIQQDGCHCDKPMNGEKEGAAEDAEEALEEEEDQPIFYDKAKSFFDNISCGRGGRGRPQSGQNDERRGSGNRDNRDNRDRI
nr:hypothetical protein BaRGS_029694 [Batillaria attramentaria]